jgi:hypothetical protein
MRKISLGINQSSCSNRLRVQIIAQLFKGIIRGFKNDDTHNSAFIRFLHNIKKIFSLLIAVVDHDLIQLEIRFNYRPFVSTLT